jgi:hypothetical protein
MYTDSIERLRGTAGARQVRVRAETALAAFTTPSNARLGQPDGISPSRMAEMLEVDKAGPIVRC